MGTSKKVFNKVQQKIFQNEFQTAVKKWQIKTYYASFVFLKPS